MTKKVFLVLLVAMFLVGCDDSKKQHDFTQKQISEATSYLETDISYPFFAGLDELNNAISESVLTNYNEFMETAQTNWIETNEIRKETGSEGDMPPFGYIVQSEIASQNRYVSILLTTYIYDGGAHGNTTLQSFTYDTKAKKMLSACDIGGITLEKLSSDSFDMLSKQLVSADASEDEEQMITSWISEGTTPTETNFSVFTYNGEKLTVYFEPYQVAAYACGILQAEFEITQ